MNRYRTWYSVTLVVVLAAALTGGGRMQPVYANDGDAVSNEIVVKLNPATGATIGAINAAYGTTTIKTLTPGAGIYLLRTPPGRDAGALAQQIANDRCVLYSEQNYVSAPPEADPSSIGGWGGTDPAPFASQYAVQVLRLAQAHTINRGAGAVVAVIDTGVQLNHPALAASLTQARFDFVDGDTTPDDVFNGRDDNNDGRVDELAGHGTHVAGVVHLVAPAARIMPLRVLDSDGEGNVWSLVEAIRYAADHGANVINLSLGTSSRSRLLEDTIRSASQRGVLVVAAVGNDKTETEQYPAADNCALGVTSVGATGKKSSFANYGNQVDVAAPGEHIFSAFPTNGYAWWSGTSMATPFVAGQAALVHSLRHTLPAGAVANVIAHTSRSIDAQNPQFAGRMGFGEIDVGNSLARLAANTVSNSGSSVLSGGCDQ